MHHACKHTGGPKLKTNRFDSSDRQRDIDYDILDVFMGRGRGGRWGGRSGFIKASN